MPLKVWTQVHTGPRFPLHPALFLLPSSESRFILSFPSTSSSSSSFSLPPGRCTVDSATTEPTDNQSHGKSASVVWPSFSLPVSLIYYCCGRCCYEPKEGREINRPRALSPLVLLMQSRVDPTFWRKIVVLVLYFIHRVAEVEIIFWVLFFFVSTSSNLHKTVCNFIVAHVYKFIYLYLYISRKGGRSPSSHECIDPCNKKQQEAKKKKKLDQESASKQSSKPKKK